MMFSRCLVPVVATMVLANPAFAFEMFPGGGWGEGGGGGGCGGFDYTPYDMCWECDFAGGFDPLPAFEPIIDTMPVEDLVLIGTHTEVAEITSIQVREAFDSLPVADQLRAFVEASYAETINQLFLANPYDAYQVANLALSYLDSLIATGADLGPLAQMRADLMSFVSTTTELPLTFLDPDRRLSAISGGILGVTTSGEQLIFTTEEVQFLLELYGTDDDVVFTPPTSPLPTPTGGP